MIDYQLANTSDTLFWVALVGYSIAAALLFAHLAYRSRTPGTIGTLIAWASAVAHLGSVVSRGLAADRVPWGNMYEFSSLIALLIVVSQLAYADQRRGLRSMSGFAIALAILTMGLARTLYVPARELQVALGGIWLKVHVLAAIIGSTLFAVSFVYSMLFLIRKRAEDRLLGSSVGAAHVGFFESTSLDQAPVTPKTIPGFAGKLPPSDRLDQLAHDTVKFAFPIWTFAVIAGAIWAHEAWSRYWAWDPKETWALITWIVYAGYLHARATNGWREKKAAILNGVAFAVVMFTYYGVNLWLPGLHSYANG